MSLSDLSNIQGIAWILKWLTPSNHKSAATNNAQAWTSPNLSDVYLYRTFFELTRNLIRNLLFPYMCIYTHHNLMFEAQRSTYSLLFTLVSLSQLVSTFNPRLFLTAHLQSWEMKLHHCNSSTTSSSPNSILWRPSSLM